MVKNRDNPHEQRVQIFKFNKYWNAIIGEIGNIHRSFRIVT